MSRRTASQLPAAAEALAKDYRRGAKRLFGDVSQADIAAFVRTVDHILGLVGERGSSEAGEPA